MKKRILYQMGVYIITILSITLIAISQDKNQEIAKKQSEILADISFDRVVGFTLTALEENYQVKERLLPRVHINDYFTVILNTAKRRALEDNKNQIVLPNSTAIPDSTKKK